MGNRPLRGERLEYQIPSIGGNDYHVRMKESIGYWLGLTPVQPRYGKFKKTDKNSVVAHDVQLGNANADFTKLAGFRFVSYKFILVPNTKITEPDKYGKKVDHIMQTIQIGFPRGAKSHHTSVKTVINFALTCKQSKKIRGIITPAGTKHLWRGKLSSASNPSGSIFTDPNPLPDLANGLGDLAGQLGSDVGGILSGLEGDLGSVASSLGGLLF